MNRNELQGKARNVKGRIKEAVGAATGNERLENEGAAERVSGAVEAGLGKVGRKLGEGLTDLGKAIKK